MVDDRLAARPPSPCARRRSRCPRTRSPPAALRVLASPSRRAPPWRRRSARAWSRPGPRCARESHVADVRARWRRRSSRSALRLRLPTISFRLRCTSARVSKSVPRWPLAHGGRAISDRREARRGAQVAARQSSAMTAVDILPCGIGGEQQRRDAVDRQGQSDAPTAAGCPDASPADCAHSAINSGTENSTASSGCFTMLRTRMIRIPGDQST